MVEIKDNAADRREERRIEDKKAETRRDVERRMQTQPMKTFEAKLAEKTAHELTTKDSALRESHDEKANKEEKQSLLDKIIGKVKEKTGHEDKSEVAQTQKQVEEQQDESVDERLADQEFETKESDKKESSKKTEQKTQEYSSEGHKRVSEKSDDQSSGGSDQFGGGADSDSGGESFQFDSADHGQDQQQHQKTFDKNVVFVGQGKVQPVHKPGKYGTGTFDKDARNFTDDNLDEIVANVQLGQNEYGEQEFKVELTDEYFEGLTVSATRTDDGIVLKFTCPNVSMRSTFLKYRLSIYARFIKKGIQVHRIDVI